MELDTPDSLPIRPLVSVPDLARVFHCTTNTIKTRIADGRLPRPMVIGGRYLWKAETITALIEDIEAQTAEAA